MSTMATNTTVTPVVTSTSNTATETVTTTTSATTLSQSLKEPTTSKATTGLQGVRKRPLDDPIAGPSKVSLLYTISSVCKPV